MELTEETANDSSQLLAFIFVILIWSELNSEEYSFVNNP